MTRGLLAKLYILVCCHIQFSTSVIKYPHVRRDESVEYDGTSVKDAYRWLEDVNGEKTLQFIRDQNALTEDFLNEVEDRQVIEDTVKKAWYEPQYRNVPVKAGGKYYHCEYPNKLGEHCTVYVQSNIQSEPKVFFNPTELFKNEPGKVAVKNFGFSKDGKIFSYCFTRNNSEWETCQFKHAETGDDLPDRIEGLRHASLEWSHDDKGFFYAAYPVQSDGRSRKFENQQGWYHTMGSPQSADLLILQFPESPLRKLAFKVSDCGKHLLSFSRMGPRANSVYITSLERGIFMYMIWKPIFGDIKEARYEYLTNNGSAFYFRTNRKAPMFQVIQVETDRVKNPRSSFASIIPENPENNLLIITRPLNKSKLLLVYSGHLTYRIELRELNDGRLLEVVNLNETAGTIAQVNENTTGETEFFLLYESMAVPGRIYHCALEDVHINCNVFKDSQLPDSLHGESIEVNLINYPGADRIMLPMLLVHKKDMVKNESTPVVIQALTHVNETIEHRFQIQALIFVNHFNGMWAVPLVRGNSQESQQLSRIARQKAFEDFFAAGRFLIHEKYAQKSKVVITGHANSAILAAVCLNREPGDFSSAIFTGGVFDILRYHQLGREFWSSVDFEQMQTKEDFSALLRLSPLHTIQKYLPSQIQYPSILVLNEATDSQISPFHSYKFTAELQNRIGNLSQQTNPLLLKVETESLREFDAKISSKVRQWSAAFSFMKRTTNLEFNSAPGLKNLVLYTVVLQYALFYFS